MSVLMPRVEVDDSELELLGFTKESVSYTGQSRFLQAANQTPITWDRRQGALHNIKQYLGSFWDRGKANISQAYGDEAIQLANAPDSVRWDRLRQQVRGVNPTISHPVDKLVEQL